MFRVKVQIDSWGIELQQCNKRCVVAVKRRRRNPLLALASAVSQAIGSFRLYSSSSDLSVQSDRQVHVRGVRMGIGDGRGRRVVIGRAAAVE